MLSNKEKVYIILVNYNGWKDTIECLESVFRLSHKNFQTIVVDNSPTDDSINQIEAWALGKAHKNIVTAHKKLVYPLKPKPIRFRTITQKESERNFYEDQLLIIKAENNKGFSAGNNIALKYALKRNDFDYCWILNNDTVVEKESLTKQILFFKENIKRKTGILGSKLVNYNNPKEIQAVGGVFSSITYTSKHIGSGLPVSTQKRNLKSIDYAVGASMFLSKNFLVEIGLMNETYFLYYEEIDWAFRAKKKNWYIDWCEDSLVYHKEGASIGSSMKGLKKSNNSDVSSFKSRKIFFNTLQQNKTMFWISSILMIINRLRRLQLKTAVSFCRILIK